MACGKPGSPKMPKKLTPTSCRCKGAGTCPVCRAKKAKALMPKGGK